MHRVEPAEPAGAAALLDHRYAQRLLPLSDAAALNLSACWLNRTQQNFKRQRPGIGCSCYLPSAALSRALQRLPAALGR